MSLLLYVCLSADLPRTWPSAPPALHSSKHRQHETRHSNQQQPPHSNRNTTNLHPGHKLAMFGGQEMVSYLLDGCAHVRPVGVNLPCLSSASPHHFSYELMNTAHHQTYLQKSFKVILISTDILSLYVMKPQLCSSTLNPKP